MEVILMELVNAKASTAGAGSAVPAGLAAAGYQKARFSDSAPFAAVLTIAAEKRAKRLSLARHDP